VTSPVQTNAKSSKQFQVIVFISVLQTSDSDGMLHGRRHDTAVCKSNSMELNIYAPDSTATTGSPFLIHYTIQITDPDMSAGWRSELSNFEGGDQQTEQLHCVMFPVTSGFTSSSHLTE